MVARLKLKGIDGRAPPGGYGLHAFAVPIRSLLSHQPLPGVLVGDIGPKIGNNSLDNGFNGFNNYRIPREYLLNKIADVTPEGKYTGENIPAGKRFALLMNPISAGRVGITGRAVTNAASALTISVRYSAARRQFGPTKEELPVLEYQLQQYRLFPFIAAIYTVEFFRSRVLVDQWALLEDQMKNNSVDDGLLAELHAISSAIKPYATWMARDAIQTSRECCGGHGYHEHTRLGILRNDHEPMLTYEGENNVLIQQASKYLLANY
eukprot:TRINITY_DN23322_c0_g1_i1.p1 TRINITY_DN23322_c0_g1~~TRINITY_DN23322_c0_g1_i1.p1  ORF type:complete len:265 (-),score=71.30 TRINITY_DN23322_c0_g1_i1:27-821(-)